MLSFFGVIHIVHTQKGGGKLLSQMLTIAYNGGEWLQNYVRMQKKTKNILNRKISKLFFYTKEVTTLLCITVYRKV